MKLTRLVLVLLVATPFVVLSASGQGTAAWLFSRFDARSVEVVADRGDIEYRVITTAPPGPSWNDWALEAAAADPAPPETIVNVLVVSPAGELLAGARRTSEGTEALSAAPSPDAPPRLAGDFTAGPRATAASPWNAACESFEIGDRHGFDCRDSSGYRWGRYCVDYRADSGSDVSVHYRTADRIDRRIVTLIDLRADDTWRTRCHIW